MIRKRQIKGNLRKSTTGNNNSGDNDGSSSDEEGGMDKTGLETVKYEQQRRKRVHGLVIDGLQAESNEPKQAKTSENFSKPGGLGAASSQQYVVRVDTGLPELKHEKLMEKYVVEKLEAAMGVNLMQNGGEVEDPTSPKFAQDTTAKPLEGNSEMGLLGTGTGIEEVALPIGFKIANIEATNAAKHRVRDDRLGNLISSSLANAGYRYDGSLGGSSGAGPAAGNTSSQGDNRGGKFSHDDMLVDKFRKAQANRRR